ncbi:uncharacterized protein V1518DRAFT_184251 [Limtongia smithiae]|uniref:uncharacterized protein n=1 Tax=Limtongia smithiae TaxID=1125753 RepID=UPI0034CE82BC
MTGENTVLSVIDISKPSAATAKALFDAASTLGFVFINGSGLTQADVNRMFGLSAKFFAEPAGEKEKFAIADNKGYAGMNQEALGVDSEEKRGDPKEIFNFGQFRRGRPDQALPPVFLGENEGTLAEVSAFAAKCHATCNAVLDLLAAALDIEGAEKEPNGIASDERNTWFSRRHDAEEASGSILRLLHYPGTASHAAPSEDKDTEDAWVRAGAHTDYGSLTLLFQRPGQEGLEVRGPDGEWLAVPALAATGGDGCAPIVVNIADQLSFWSAGVLTSAYHRVRFEPRPEDRYSIAYFCHPADATLLEPVPSQIVRTSGAPGPAGEVLSAGEHLARRLAASYL